MIDEPPRTEPLRAAGLTALLSISGWLLSFAISWALNQMGVRLPRMGSGGGEAGASGGLVVLIMFGLLCALAIAAAVVVAALWERARPGAAWRHAATAAAVPLLLLLLALLLDGPSLNVLVSTAVPIVLLLGAGQLRMERPELLACVVPGVALVLGLVATIKQGMEEAAAAGDDAYYRAVEKAAGDRDSDALRVALDALPARGAPTLDGILWSLPAGGEHLREIEQILAHPKTPKTGCAQLLRAALDGDEAAWNLLVPALISKDGITAATYCEAAAANLAARGGHEPVARLAAQLVSENDRISILWQLVSAPAIEAALLWMKSAELIDQQGRLRAGLMKAHFIDSVWSHADSEAERRFFWEHADIQALLVAVAAQDARADRLDELLHQGGKANQRLPCGATPLTALSTGHDLLRDPFLALLDGGADPNLPGTPFCLDGAPALPLEPPLWHLIRRKGDWNNLPGEVIQLLVKRGANPRARSADGGSLFDEASDDPSLLRALKGEDPYHQP